MKSHDVRHLKICPACHSIGHAREMVCYGLDHYHGRCFEADFGLDALLALPAAQRAKLTLGDVGNETMAILVDLAEEEEHQEMQWMRRKLKQEKQSAAPKPRHDPQGTVR